ncbi:MAG: CDP-diacylglycerol--glycerol-3-phosphate 3-phosphatidyltransferase [Oscillospiraceae bacterium]|jgi:CDP-diacylglycerol--glycerol-3-phosphate 3-phosphatidyltransferase|nr:CDP-diacylglycerol--glycerol-3-phosphate 3-phosphatidyltransferase [Oscillospiraceae bacterium]
MNIANILTLSRIILIIPFVAFLLNGCFLVALIIFITASVTDWLDGFIARKFNMITDLGKFLDPLADKILVISAMICFVELNWIPAWTVIVIAAREFIVTGFRLGVVEKDNKSVIAADIWGKIKTAFTMPALCAILVMWVLAAFEIITHYRGFIENPFSSFIEVRNVPQYVINPISNILMYICAALTVFSGITMIIKNRKLFTNKERN